MSLFAIETELGQKYLADLLLRKDWCKGDGSKLERVASPAKCLVLAFVRKVGENIQSHPVFFLNRDGWIFVRWPFSQDVENLLKQRELKHFSYEIRELPKVFQGFS